MTSRDKHELAATKMVICSHPLKYLKAQLFNNSLMQAHIDWVAHNHLNGSSSCSLQPYAWCPCIHAKFSPSLILWRLEQDTQITEKHNKYAIKHSEMNVFWNSATEKQTKISTGSAHKSWDPVLMTAPSRSKR